MEKVHSVLLFIIICIRVSVSDDVPCALRHMEFGGVCVCNATYCDTVERPTPLPRGHYYHYTTSNVSPGFHRTYGSFRNNHIVDNQTLVFIVNPTIQYQEIFGFGGAFTDATGSVVNTLPPEVQNKFFQSYFSKSGIEYSMGRIPIGATDFSPRLYTYDDVPNDEELKHFGLAEEDFKYKIPHIKKALDVSPHEMKLIGSIFTAPKWMKLNETWTAAFVKEEYFDAWAQYHIKFLDAYADNGIQLWSLTGGNEVMLDLLWHGVLVVDTGAMPHDHIRWIRDHLAPQLAASNHTHIKLLIMDDVRMFAKLWMSRFARDSTAYQLVEGIALHWYFDWGIPEDIFNKMAKEFHDSFPDKLIFYTESSINVLFQGEPVELGSWKRATFYSYSIIKNLNLWTSGYLDWNLALDLEGGPNLNLPTDAAIIVNASSGEFYKNPIFYSLGHFSKFIPPGSKRVDVQSNENATTRYNQSSSESMFQPIHEPYVASITEDWPGPQVPQRVTCVATLNSDNSSTIILLNTMETDVNVTIVDTASGYITATLTANSINTFVYWPGDFV